MWSDLNSNIIDNVVLETNTPIPYDLVNDLKIYEYGEPGHFVREWRVRKWSPSGFQSSIQV